MNLSGRAELDALRLTDLIASELQTFPDVQVIPVNRALAVLATRGKTIVSTPTEAVELARDVGADATLVFAITEYDPYDPPVVGMTAQWYLARERAGREAPPESAANLRPAPRPDVPGDAALHLQVQRVFNAADKEVAKKLRAYADDRDRHDSPHGWRRYQRSQELYVRYCGWALIETMFTLDAGGLETAQPHEARK